MSANMKMSIDCEIVYKLNEKKILKYTIEMVKLEDYTTTELKKMISSFNKIVKFVGYSKKKKAELITMIRTHPKVKVEEGVNAVKLSIKTDENFEKQKKVKKEVEKLDDVKVVVKAEKKKEEPDKKLTLEELKNMPINKATKLDAKILKRLYNEYEKELLEEIKKSKPSTTKEYAKLERRFQPNGDAFKGIFAGMPFDKTENIEDAFMKIKKPEKEKVIETQEDKTYDAITKLSKFLSNILPDENEKITKATQLKQLNKFLKDNKKEYADFLSISKFNPSKFLTFFRSNYTDYAANYTDDIKLELLQLYEKNLKEEPEKKKEEEKKDPKELYKNEEERISVDDKLKPNLKKINSEILNQILLINPKLNDENKELLKDYIMALSKNALDEGQIDQSVSFLKDLYKPNIIKKGTDAEISKRIKKRRQRFQNNSGI